jgi:hypothetical protein
MRACLHLIVQRQNKFALARSERDVYRASGLVYAREGVLFAR